MLNKCFFFAAFVSTMAVSVASAIVISSDAGNTTAPNDCPGFAYVGKFPDVSGSFVYLGNGWAITAKHVIDFNGGNLPEVAEIGGTQFDVDTSFYIHIDAANNSDIAIFQLIDDPELTPLQIAPRTTPVDARVVMVGSGLKRGVAATNGYETAWAHDVGWGETVNASGYHESWNAPFMDPLICGFDSAIPASGDSGGGAFPEDINNALAGIIGGGVSPIPGVDAVFGYNTGGGVNLAPYREEIISYTGTGVMGDTDADGHCNVQDYINVINNFGNSGVGVLGDTNGDDTVNVQDYINVINNFGS